MSDKVVNAENKSHSVEYDEKLRIAQGDALWALVALAWVVIVWLVCGFGLASLDITVFHTPLWIVTGLLGTWIAAIIAAVALARRFKNHDFDFDDEDAAPELSSDKKGSPQSSAACNQEACHE